MVNGVIKQVLTKPWQDKTFYSIQLVNDNTFYGFGAAKPKAAVGDFVAFHAAQNSKGFWQADPQSLAIEANPSPVRSGATAYNPQKDYAAKDTYWKDKEKRDIENDKLRSLGAARNTAIEWVKFLVEKEALPMGKTVAKREESLNLVLDDYTKKFMSGIDEKKDSAPAGVVDVAPETPHDDEWK
jgi:hypothetical protein